MREWTNEELKNYVTLFNDQIRDTVLKDILEADILSRFLSTSEGRLVLNNVVDEIAKEIQKIISLSGGGDEQLQKIKQAAMKIDMSYEFMKNLATIGVKGEVHVEGMKRKRNERL